MRSAARVRLERTAALALRHLDPTRGGQEDLGGLVSLAATHARATSAPSVPPVTLTARRASARRVRPSTRRESCTPGVRVQPYERVWHGTSEAACRGRTRPIPHRPHRRRGWWLRRALRPAVLLRPPEGRQARPPG